MTARDRLDEIQQRADAATEGPWRIEDHSNHGEKPSWVLPDIERWRGYTNSVGLGEDRETAEFIAHARQDVPALVGALRAVLDLHPVGVAYGVNVCQVCSQVKDEDEWDDPNDSPIASWLPFPCPTVRAITDALGGEQA